MRENSSLLYAELRRVIASMTAGDLESRMRTEGLKGESAAIVAEFNRMLDVQTEALATSSAALHSLAHGRVPDFVSRDFPGGYNRLKQDTNLCVAMVTGVLLEVDDLVRSAKSGRIAARANDWDFDGCWKDLLSRLNEMVDAFIRPFHLASQYLEAISQGVIPERVTERYPGDLNRIKRNLNTLLETLECLLADVNNLCSAAIEGRLDQRADADRYGNEFRRIVAGINGTLNAVVEPLKAGANTLNRVAQGDLTVRLEGAFSGEFAALQSDINSMADRLRHSMEQICVTAQEISVAAEQLTGISSDLTENAGCTAERAEMASSTSREIARSVQELSAVARNTASAIDEIAGEVDQVSRQVHSADGAAQSALQAVSRLTDASSNIGDVAKVIHGVAGETNSLSSTAERQAETAVSASRGFGIVADEVKRLADQTAAAADSLNDQVGGIQGSISTALSRLATETESGKLLTKLLQSSREAGRGIQAISQLAWQTRIIALNANVEGARATNSADLFTGVAHEIGNLAGQTAKAAVGISERLDSIGASSRDGAATIESIASTVRDLREAADSIARQTQEKARTTAMMGESAAAAAQSAGQIVDHAATVAEAASHTKTAARKTDHQARQLAETAVRLQDLVGGFRI